MSVTREYDQAAAAVRRGPADLPDELDVLVVGAGISGIGAAYRLLERDPDLDLAVLEARDSSGGTWDLFRYPGVRSDSDMYSLSFPFRPWDREQSIADGASILEYLRETAADSGIAERTYLGCSVVAASWSSQAQRWSVEVDGADGSARVVRARYVHLGSGYYDYDSPHDPGFVGVEDFAGEVVHPQHWPQDLDLAGRRVVVIGSGATAVSLVPAAAQTAASVTMLQRTPSYVIAVPASDRLVERLRRVLPPGPVQQVARTKNVLVQRFLYVLSRVRPSAARGIVLGALRRVLPQEVVDEHFTPPYDVWDQRLCAVRDGDLFTAIRSGSVEVVTGHVDRFERGGIRLQDGRLVEADVVVTATGLRLKALGGIRLTVDDRAVDIGRTFAYRGLMLSGVPNMSMTVGYVNASWTLRADLVSGFVARLVHHMREHGIGAAVPVAPEGMTPAPILDLTSGYVQRAVGAFPKVGDRDPWTMEQSYMKDRRAFRAADVTQDMHLVPLGAVGVHLPTGAAAPATVDLPGSSSNTDDSVGDLVEVRA